MSDGNCKPSASVAVIDSGTGRWAFFQEIASHGWRHRGLPKLSDDELREEVEKNGKPLEVVCHDGFPAVINGVSPTGGAVTIYK